MAQTFLIYHLAVSLEVDSKRSEDKDMSVPLLVTVVVLGALSAAAMAYFKFT